MNGEDGTRFLMPVDTNISLNSVILSDANKERINTFLQEFRSREKIRRYGLEPMNRLLFYGASGCGKTYLTKALSNHMNYTLLYIDIASALSSGVVGDNLKEIFEIANTGRYMVFLDECDSIAWARDAKSGGDGGDVRRATNALFQLLDQMSPDVVFVSATNMLHRLDPAFERRFNMKLEFVRPDAPLCETVRRFIRKGFSFSDDGKNAIVEQKSKKLSYFEIQTLTERVMKDAIINDTLIVCMSAIYSEALKVLNIKEALKTDRDYN